MSRYSWSVGRQIERIRSEGCATALHDFREGLGHMRDRAETEWLTQDQPFREGYEGAWAQKLLEVS